MYWRIYGYATPANGEACIVGRVYNGETQTGVFDYHFNGSESYWENRGGYKVKCDKHDNWCPVQSVIDKVAEKIEDDIEWEMEKVKLNKGYLL